MKNLLLLAKNSGFTLLETMLSMGLGVAISYMLLSSNMNTSKNLSIVQGKSDLAILAGSINSVLINTKVCTEAFRNFVFNTTGNTSVPGIYLKGFSPPPAVNTSTNNSMVTVGKNYSSNLYVSSLTFTNPQLVQNTTSNYNTVLRLTTQTIMGNSKITQVVNKDFTMVVTLNASKVITSCQESIGATSSNLWQLNANNQDIYYNTGNVGIGNAAPTFPLHFTRANQGNLIRGEIAGNSQYFELNTAWSTHLKMRNAGVDWYTAVNPWGSFFVESSLFPGSAYFYMYNQSGLKKSVFDSNLDVNSNLEVKGTLIATGEVNFGKKLVRTGCPLTDGNNMNGAGRLILNKFCFDDRTAPRTAKAFDAMSICASEGGHLCTWEEVILMCKHGFRDWVRDGMWIGTSCGDNCIKFVNNATDCSSTGTLDIDGNANPVTGMANFYRCCHGTGG